MDNRLQILSALMLLAMVSMMALQTTLGANSEMVAEDRGASTFRPFPTVLAMSPAGFDGTFSDTQDR
mgnify:CR=1 FL=1|jgi:hypothetical protein